MQAIKRVVHSLAAIALVGGFSLSAHAQIGCGWTSTSVSYTTQTSGGTITPYPSGGGVFQLPIGGRQAIQRFPLSGTTSTEFQGTLKVDSFGSSANNVIVMEIIDPAPSTPWVRLAIRNLNGGQFVDLESGAVLGSMTVGVPYQINVVVDPSTGAYIYINGALVEHAASRSGAGYLEIGAIIPPTGFGPVTVTWTNIHFWTGGTINCTMVATPQISPPSGNYSPGNFPAVTLSTITPGASIYFTTDGSTPSPTHGTLYTGPIRFAFPAIVPFPPETIIIEAMADETGYTESSVAVATYTISTGVAAPIFSPPPGTYSSPVSVIIADAASGVSIRYTTDGSTPSETNGTIYSGPVNIGITTTLEAIAYGAGLGDSQVVLGTYTIHNACTTVTGISNFPLSSPQTGTFTVTWDATPSESPMNVTMALCHGSQTTYNGLACIARFNPSGDIDVRNGGSYDAVSTIPYSAGTTYHFSMIVNVPAHTYSVYLNPPPGTSGPIQLVASNYAFRTEQSAVTSLDTFNVDVNDGGSVSICNVTVSP